MISENKRSPTSRLAQLIKELRGTASQREFAKLLGTSYTTIQDWEKQVRLPSSKNIQRLSQLKGWTQAELINHLFELNAPAEFQDADPVEHIISNLDSLSPEQMQALSEYLLCRMNSQKNFQNDTQR